MKILFIASEATPLVKVGGLADVVGSLPKALRAQHQDVRILIPQYGSIDIESFPLSPLRTLRLSGGDSVNLNRTNYDDVPVYTLENPKNFGTREVYWNDLERFFFFSRAVFEILPKMDWQPEILHCHDWHTALTIMWAKKAAYPYSTVFTIHNLAYQGFFDDNFLMSHNLKKDWDYFPPDAPRPPHSFMAQAVLWADLVTTVSETYAGEITTPEFGVGLEALLKYRRGSLTGIVNGIDYEYWNPQTDEFLPVNFNSASMKKRIQNKFALQKVAGLPVSNEAPLIGMVERLDEQKGIDIVGQGVDRIMQETAAQLVVLGQGRDSYERMMQQIASRYPQRVAAFIAFEEPLAHLIYGGCDLFLMPSHFEPCGLGQMIAMRYGALPIVRHTGGLVDTVPEFNDRLDSGNGFVFHEYSAGALAAAIKQAAEAYKQKKAWLEAMQRVSRLDFSWQSSASRYQTAYGLLLEKVRSN